MSRTNRATKAAVVLFSSTMPWAVGVAQTDDGAALDEIVVTARKVEEKLNEIPLAITAFTAEDLQKRNVNSLDDVAKYTSGFSFEGYSGGTNPAPIIRGLTQNSLADRNQNVATFVDGIHIQQANNIDFALLDSERIEVLKGPQNSQYGRSAFAGAINYVSAQPVLGKWVGNISATYGTDDRKDLKASLSIPLWADKLAVRLYGVTSEFDGTWENKFSTGDKGIATTSMYGTKFDGTDGNVGGWDNQASSIKVRFQPIESLTLDGSYYRSEVKNEYGPTVYIRPFNNLVGLPYSTNCSPNAAGLNQLYCGELKLDTATLKVDPRNTGGYTHTDLMTTKLSWEASENLSFTYLWGRNLLDFDAHQQASAPANPEIETCDAFTNRTVCPTGTPGWVVLQTGRIEQTAESHELRLDGKAFDTRATWRLGYYTSIVSDSSLSNSIQRRRSVVNDPTGQVVLLTLGVLPNRFRDKTDAYFGSASWKFNDAWTLETEGRYSQERRVQRTGTVPAKTFTEFTPRVNLKWQPRENWMFYTSYAEGSKSGGFNTAAADPGFETYGPEQNETYELGAKLTLLDGKLQLNSTLFMVDWKGLQLTVPDNIQSNPPLTDPNYIANVSGAESKGLELDAVYALGNHWRFNFSGSIVDPTYDEDVFDLSNAGRCNSTVRVCDPAITIARPAPLAPVAAVDVGGNQIARTPKLKLALGVEYRGSFGEWEYAARGDVSHQDKQYVEILNLAYLPERTLVDLNFTVTSPDQAWSASLWGKNVTDEAVVQNALFLGFLNAYGSNLAPGAQWGITARYNLNRER